MNKTVEKYLYILITLLITTGFIVFICFNLDKKIDFFCPVMQKVYTTNLAYITLGFFAAAGAAGYSLCAFMKMNVESLCNAYQKRHENISIEKDTDKSRIATLEAKIATLEAALESALKKDK